MADFFKIALKEAWQEQTNYLKDDNKELKMQIKEIEEKLSIQKNYYYPNN